MISVKTQVHHWEMDLAQIEKAKELVSEYFYRYVKHHKKDYFISIYNNLKILFPLPIRNYSLPEPLHSQLHQIMMELETKFTEQKRDE